MIPVKICGITNRDDALCVAGNGASAVGFIFFAKSPRAVSPSVAHTIANSLPPGIKKGGVFVNQDKSFIQHAIQSVPLDFIQLHGEEPPAFCTLFPIPVFKAWRIKDPHSLKKRGHYPVTAFLLDTWKDGQYGGTGVPFDWNLLQGLTWPKPIILSGGLSPENVSAAIRTVQPNAIDVNSGVERSLGKKDHRKIKKLFHQLENTKDTGFTF